MKVNHKYDTLNNKDYTIEFSKYITEVFKNVTENWDSCVEKLAEIVIKMVGRDISEEEARIVLGRLFTSGEVQRVTNMPEDKYDFESLYDWQQLHLNVILEPLYVDVIGKVIEK